MESGCQIESPLLMTKSVNDDKDLIFGELIRPFEISSENTSNFENVNDDDFSTYASGSEDCWI